MTLEEFNKIDSDIVRGRLSGIPDCCIAFFTEVWEKGMFIMMPDYMGMGSWGYVPCPHCKVTGNRKELIIHESGKARKTRAKAKK